MIMCLTYTEIGDFNLVILVNGKVTPVAIATRGTTTADWMKDREIK